MEKKYKKGLNENKFNKFYWSTSFFLIFGSFLLKIPDNVKPYFIYVLLSIFFYSLLYINLY